MKLSVVVLFVTILVSSCASSGSKMSANACNMLIDISDEERIVELISTEDVNSMLESEVPSDLVIGDGMHLSAVSCQRESIVPDVNDFKFPSAGISFYREKYENGKKANISVLEKVGGSYRIRVIKGSFAEDERELARQRINDFNAIETEK